MESSNDALSVLLVTDDTSFGLSVEEDLGDSGKGWFTLARLAHVAQAEDRARDLPPDLTLIDWHCAGMSPDTITRLRKAAPRTAIIILTKPQDTNIGSRALRAGAEECVCPANLTPKALRALLSNTAHRHQMRTESDEEARAERERLARQLHLDPETGLHNASYIGERLERELLRSSRYGNKLTLIVIDLLDRREIVVGYGDDGLKAVMRKLAGIIKQGFRKIDEVGLLEPGRFAAVCVESTAQQALVPVQRIVADAESREFDMPGGRSIKIALAVGVAEWLGGVADGDCLIHSALQALHVAVGEPAGKRIKCAGPPPV